MMPFSQDEFHLTYAKDSQLDFIPTFYKMRTISSKAASASILRRTRAAQRTSTPPKSSNARKCLVRSPSHKCAAAPRASSNGSPPSTPPMHMPRTRG
jgi:hypothetical protein